MHIKNFILAFFTFTLLLACASAEVTQSPSTTGAIAPDFTLPDQDGKLWTAQRSSEKSPRRGAGVLSQR